MNDDIQGGPVYRGSNVTGERRGHDQQLIPQQCACKAATQNFMALL
jgi:hypothetical protein